MTWLTQPLADTFKTVVETWRSTRQIRDRHVENTPSMRAIANRLQKLRAEKCVVCRKVGREKIWRRL